MIFYKLNKETFHSKLSEINTAWLALHQAQNPNDLITTKYTDGVEVGAYGYILKDGVTEQYITEHLGFVTDLYEKLHQPEMIVDIFVQEQEMAVLSARQKANFLIENNGFSTQEQVSMIATVYPQWNELTNFYGPNNPENPVTIFAYESKLYKTLQDHTRQNDWLPTTAVSLYVEITPPGVIPAWRPPQGVHDAWPLGVQVTHNGHLWESDIDNNTTVPGENPEHNYWIDLGVWPPQEPGGPEPPANPCDSIALWDSTQDWNSYVTGELRKWEIGGVMKVFSCNSKQWAYIEPGQPYSGWKYEYDCPA